MSTDNASDQGDYRTLADHIITLFNVPRLMSVGDGTPDVWELRSVITRAVAFIETQVCDCSVNDPDEQEDPCRRCVVLGRRADMPLENQ